MTLAYHPALTSPIRMPDSLTPSQRIRKTVAQHFGLTVEQLVAQDQRHRIAHPRQLGMKLVHERTNLSLAQIARVFGRTDHSTAHHGVQQATIRVEDDPKWAAHEAAIVEALKG